VSTCELKLELLREYVAARESMKTAQLEYREMLLSGSKETILRSRQRMQELKARCNAARMLLIVAAIGVEKLKSRFKGRISSQRLLGGVGTVEAGPLIAPNFSGIQA